MDAAPDLRFKRKRKFPSKFGRGSPDNAVRTSLLCQIPSHPRRSCPLRIKHLAEQVDKLYHPSKGMVESNNERRRINKSPTAEHEDDTNHNIGGQTRIRSSHVKDTTSHPTKQGWPPDKIRKLTEQTDDSGMPKYWSSPDGKLMVSPSKLPLCHYCGVPSHGRGTCKNRLDDEDAGRFYKIHPNRGKILSNNEATKRFQPANGASYQEHKRLCRNDKDRARTAKTWNQLVNSSNIDCDMVDKNHNTQSTTGPFSPKPPSEPTYQKRPAGIRKSQSTEANRCYPENFSPITRLKLKLKEKEPMNHLRYKARLVNDGINDSPTNLNTMPSEILEKILSYTSFRQRIGLQRANKRIRDVTLNRKFWETITIQDIRLSNSVMRDIIKLGAISLNLPNCVWKPTFREIHEIENFVIANRPKLTFLGLQGYRGDDAIMATIVLLAEDLTSLDISESRYALISAILNKLNRANKLTAINLSTIRHTSL